MQTKTSAKKKLTTKPKSAMQEHLELLSQSVNDKTHELRTDVNALGAQAAQTFECVKNLTGIVGKVLNLIEKSLPVTVKKADAGETIPAGITSAVVLGEHVGDVEGLAGKVLKVVETGNYDAQKVLIALNYLSAAGATLKAGLLALGHQEVRGRAQPNSEISF